MKLTDKKKSILRGGTNLNESQLFLKDLSQKKIKTFMGFKTLHIF